MSDHINPGEPLDSDATITFQVYTEGGLLADGGTNGDYEGTALGTPTTIEYEHNKDGWGAATGTFGTLGSGEFYYTFSAAERAIGLSRGTIAVRITKTGFRRQTARVQFGSGIQPGDTGDQALIFTQLFTGDGLLANGGSDAFYEAPIPTGFTLTWDRNFGGFGAALGTLTQHFDEWYYQPDPTEVGSLLARGTVAIRIVPTGASPTGYRTQTARRGFGDTTGGAAPSIVVVSPTPSTAPGAPGGFSDNFFAAKTTPIVVELTAVGGLSYAAAYVNGALAYRAGVLVGDFIAASRQEAITGGVRLHLLPSAGWPPGIDPFRPTFIVASFDAVAGSSLSLAFSWNLPPAITAPPIAPSLLAGARDCEAEALSRLIWQFRS